MTKPVNREHLKTGQPTKYRPGHAELTYKLCLLGATDEQIADAFNVVRDTVAQWKTVHPEFSDAIARGRERADAEIGHSLYHRAKGYSHPAVKIFMPAGADEPVIVPYVEHYPPDTPAASLWLRNRRGRLRKPEDDPVHWAEKIEAVHSGTLTLAALVEQAHAQLADRGQTIEGGEGEITRELPSQGSGDSNKP